MPIPQFRKNGELPPGEYEASLDEIRQRFGLSNPQRIALIKGLYEAVSNFVTAGIKRIWVNGGFITNKPDPKDIDGCWEYSPGVDLKKLDPVFLFTSRIPMKAKFGLDFFSSSVIELSSGLPFPKFFQTNRDGEPKGILVVKIGGIK